MRRVAVPACWVGKVYTQGESRCLAQQEWLLVNESSTSKQGSWPQMTEAAPRLHALLPYFFLGMSLSERIKRAGGPELRAKVTGPQTDVQTESLLCPGASSRLPLLLRSNSGFCRTHPPPPAPLCGDKTGRKCGSGLLKLGARAPFSCQPPAPAQTRRKELITD